MTPCMIGTTALPWTRFQWDRPGADGAGSVVSAAQASTVASMSTACCPSMLEMRSGQLKIPQSPLRVSVVSPLRPFYRMSL